MLLVGIVTSMAVRSMPEASGVTLMTALSGASIDASTRFMLSQ